MKKSIIASMIALLMLTVITPVVSQPASAALLPRTRKAIGRTFNVRHGTVTAINGTTLTVQTDNGILTVQTDSNTKFRRQFWGDSSISDISVSDWVNVKGQYTDDAKTTMLATYVRDTSVSVRLGTFFGIVKSKTDSSFVIDPNRRGDQTVFYDSNTRFIDKNGTIISSSSVNVGDNVRVKGMWDRKLKKITKVREIKDFSQPATASSTITPSPTSTQ